MPDVNNRAPYLHDKIPMPPPVSSPRLPPSMVALMAVATGLTVASNYYAQPLLHTIARYFDLSIASAGFLVTTAQLGYSLGLMLLVPLGDILERRRLIVGMSLLVAAGLLLTAFGRQFWLILLGTALTGLFSVVAQVLVPYAASLAAPSERGRVVGTIMSGLLLGILLARTLAGALAALGGWQTVYWVAAILMSLMAFALWRTLPAHRPDTRLSYPRLLASVFLLFVEEPVLRLRALLGAIVFGAFSLLWTPMAFLLARAPFHYSDATIGLFGLAGAAGALAASRAGRLADAGHAGRATTFGLCCLLLSWLPIALAKSSIVAFVIGVLLLDLAVQAVHVTNQSVIYRTRPEARSRLTAAYMTCYFIGGALGSVTSTAIYMVADWTGVMIAGAILTLTGLVIWWFSTERKVIDRHAA